jgi:hypothetical protein
MQATIKHAVDRDELDALFTADERVRLELYTDNIINTYLAASPAEREAGLDWYPSAARLAHRIALACGLSFKQAAAVLAVTSPSVSWGNQVKYTLPFVEAVLAGADARSVKGPFYGANKVKAARILLDGDLSALSGVKVTAFYRNICGDHDEATIDRHALRIALNKDLNPEQCKVLLNPRSRERVLVMAAYHLAARRLGIAVALVQAVTWVVFRGSAN